MGISLNPGLERRIELLMKRGLYRSADEVVERGLDLLDAQDRAAQAGTSAERNGRSIWEIIQEISSSVPDEEWAKLPPDLSKNLDHYLYGAPKAEE